MRKRVAGLLALTTLVAVPVALAHLVTTSGNYTKDPICVNGSSSMAEGPPQVMVEAWTQSSSGVNCLTAKNMPAGHLTVRRQLFHWNGSAWALCADSGWLTNTEPTSYMSRFRQWDSMPCGGGWYDHLGISQAFYNGQWLGGSRWSGQHAF